MSWIESLDEQQIVEVHKLMQQEWWRLERTLDEVRSVIAGSDLILAHLDDDGSVAAFLRVLTDQVFKAVLFDIIVRKDHRDSGLGRKLVERTINHAMLQNVKSIELYCPDRMSGFYRKLGFEVSKSKLHCLYRP